MSGVVGQGLGVFGSCIATPIGAALLLALLVIGALKLIHRSSRGLSTALPIGGGRVRPVGGWRRIGGDGHTRQVDAGTFDGDGRRLPQVDSAGGFQHHRVSVPRRYGPFPEGF